MENSVAVFNLNQPMVCGSTEAESKVYTKHKGSSGHTWYWCDSEHVYVDGHKNGFAGREIQLPMVDGTTEAVTGLWSSNSEAFETDTGVTVDHSYPISYMIGRLDKSAAGKFQTYNFAEVIDQGEVNSTWQEILDLARRLDKEHGGGLFCCYKTSGGGSAGMVYHPKKRKN